MIANNTIFTNVILYIDNVCCRKISNLFVRALETDQKAILS